MSILDEPSTSLAVVAAAVVASGSRAPTDTAAAIGRQVYGPVSVTVVGGKESATGSESAADLGAFLAGLDQSVTHVWLVHDDAMPRPDALGALVGEARRVGAAIAGSKILHLENPELLESVGFATDIFEIPFTGLEPGEVDQEQYDVVRDVAVVPGVSLLVERSVLVEIGIDPLLAPESAATDFCQRARLAGHRVVVVPSSEVLHAASCVTAVPRWREDAGRIRAALKSYSLITLLWLLPTGFLLGIAEALLAPVAGRWRLFDVVRAWGWNLVVLPSTVAGRLRGKREAGDAELFRYQVRGSVRVRRFGQIVAERLRARAGAAKTVAHWVEAGQERAARPAVAAAALGAVFVLIATRSIIANGLPSVGFTLPLPESATAALRSYAGGWNVAGLGSPDPVRPAVALSALVQVLVGGRSGAAAALITVGAMIGALVGVSRLLGGWGIGPYPRYLAGVVYLAGPATAAITGAGGWPALIALGVLPAALVPVFHGDGGRRALIGRMAGITLACGVGAAYLPTFLAVPGVAALLWMVVGRGRRVGPAGLAVVGAVLALPLLAPWITNTDPGFLESGAAAYWRPSWWAVVFFAIALGGAVYAADSTRMVVAAWGGLAVGVGAIVARSGSFGWGRDVGDAGLLLAALGTAAVVGAALESITRIDAGSTARRLAAVASTGAVVVLVVAAIVHAIPGRAGLPGDEVGELLRFTSAAPEVAEGARALLIGSPGTLPGTSRGLGGGVSYRVVSATGPRAWELWLTDARLGDVALAGVIESLRTGATFRAGEELAGFGIKWVVLTEPNAVLEQFLQGQLDLRSLGISGFAVYEVEAVAGRAIADDGTVWAWDAPDYTGPAGPGTVRLAENADPRWQPGPWSQDVWANVVAASTGRASFGAAPGPRLQAWAAFGYLVALVVAVALFGGRRRGSAP